MSDIDDIKRRAGISEEQLDEFFWLTHPDELKRKLALPDDRKVGKKPGVSDLGKEMYRQMQELEKHVGAEGEAAYREAMIAFSRMGRMLRAT